MSTNARIGIENADGSITTSYHHWDGYPAGLGFNLAKNWNDPELLAGAIALGDASHWADTIGEQIEFDQFPRSDAYYAQNVYYNRDRSESWEHTKPIVYKTFEVFEKSFLRNTPCGEEYAYILRLDGTWTQIAVYAKEVTHDAATSIYEANAAMQRMIKQEAV